MKYLKQFWANAQASPKTSAMGAAGLVGSGVAAFHDPAKLVAVEWWTVVFVSAGLLFTPDHKAQA
ncbi:MAG: hypothetical protein M1541_04890 [Acidobacteria bacterium]|nr:hypothetical protein [Acidobacteriota bacterium]